MCMELPVTTREGVFVASYTEKGLAGLAFPKRHQRTVAGSSKVPSQVRQWHRATTQTMKAVLAGQAAGPLPPLDWTGSTDFQQAVWRELLKLGPGVTKSYGEIAVAMGKPKAVRAVGGACGANPVPVLVPCHRVLAANRKLGGFSGGLDWKRKLLARENVIV